MVKRITLCSSTEYFSVLFTFDGTVFCKALSESFVGSVRCNSRTANGAPCLGLQLAQSVALRSKGEFVR